MKKKMRSTTSEKTGKKVTSCHDSKCVCSSQSYLESCPVHVARGEVIGVLGADFSLMSSVYLEWLRSEGQIALQNMVQTVK